MLAPRFMIEEFDRASRHTLVGRAVRLLTSAPASVLDVGGSGGLTGRELPGYRVTTVDTGGGADVKASAANLPFPDRSFDVVVALDLLEHVPAELRSTIIGELVRASRLGLVLAGPFRSDAITAAERRTMSRYREMTGRPHRWLAEHAAHGLPELDETVATLRRSFEHVTVETSNPIELWERLLLANFIAAELGFPDTATHETLLAHYLDAGDADTPAYRHILIAADQPLTGQLRSETSAGMDTADALTLVDSALARTVREATTARKTAVRHENQLRAGMHSARDEVNRLAEVVRRAKSTKQDLKQRQLQLKQELEAIQARLGDAERDRDRYRREAADQSAAKAEAERGVASLRVTVRSLRRTPCQTRSSRCKSPEGRHRRCHPHRAFVDMEDRTNRADPREVDQARCRSRPRANPGPNRVAGGTTDEQRERSRSRRATRRHCSRYRTPPLVAPAALGHADRQAPPRTYPAGRNTGGGTAA